MELSTYLANMVSASGRPGLERIHVMLEHLGRPERDLKIVHVVGTNGKGSTAQFIASVLQSAGKEVGLFISPHLVEFNERIQVNGVPIEDGVLGSIFQELYPCLEKLTASAYGQPGMFEIATALAIRYFSMLGVDYAVLEAGMGGRYDATHIGHPVVTVFTHIDLDHTEVLGKTVELIAAEKADVIPFGGTVVTAPQASSVRRVITKFAEERGSVVVDIEREYRIEGASPGSFGTRFSVSGRGRWRHLHINLLGLFQITNAVTALATIDVLAGKGLEITDDQVVRGLASAQWPGRLEVVSREPLVVLDGAHNLDGCRQLAAALPVYFTWGRLHLIMSIVGEKPAKAMLDTLLPQAETVIFTTPQFSRVRPIEPIALQQLAAGKVEETGTAASFSEAFDEIRRRAHKGDLICICGSLYLIGEARKQLLAQRQAAGIMYSNAESSNEKKRGI